MERCPLCEVVTGCVDYGYSMTPINVAKKNLPGLKRDTSQAVVETMQTQSDKFSTPGQARMGENTGLGILVHCTSRGRRGTLEPVMRYFVAGAGLGRFRSLIPCACHATDSQHTVNTTVNTSTFPENSQSKRILDSCSPDSSLRLEILKFPHATRVLLENCQEKCSC